MNPSKGGLESSTPSFVDEAAVKRTLREALMFEMLEIYTDPEHFEQRFKPELIKFWLPVEQGGKNIEQIEATVFRLLKRGLHYGQDATLERLDFRSVQIHGDTAEAETRERWFVPLFDNSGDPVPKHNSIQNWEVAYKLRKVNGSWLIKESTAPYASAEK